MAERLASDEAVDERRTVRAAAFGRCLQSNLGFRHRCEYEPPSLLAPQWVPFEVVVVHTAHPLLLIWLA